MSRSYYAGKLLIFGIINLGFGLFLSWQSWVSRSELTPVKSQLYTADIRITDVESRGAKSKKSELIFYLEGHSYRFILAENIGQSSSNPEYTRILSGLKTARFVDVYIKESDLDENQPKVYAIVTDNGVLLDFETVRKEHSWVATFCLGIGLFSILFWFYHRNKR